MDTNENACFGWKLPQAIVIDDNKIYYLITLKNSKMEDIYDVSSFDIYIYDYVVKKKRELIIPFQLFRTMKSLESC